MGDICGKEECCECDRDCDCHCRVKPKCKPRLFKCRCRCKPREKINIHIWHVTPDPVFSSCDPMDKLFDPLMTTQHGDIFNGFGCGKEFQPIGF